MNEKELTGGAARGTVILTDLRTAPAREAKDHLEQLGYSVVVPPEDCSLCDEQALRAFAEEYRETLTGVIHPAPPMMKAGILEITREMWEKARDEGPVAALMVLKVFGGIFREKKSGTIIFLSSIHAEKPVGKGMLYSTGCGAVDMMTKEAMQDYGPNGVSVYFVERGILEEDPGKSDVSALYYHVDMRYPRRSVPAPSYLNDLLAFLLTPGARVLAGNAIHAEEGLLGFYGSHRDTVEGYPYLVRKIDNSPVTDKRRDPAEIAEVLRPEEKEERVCLITGGGKGVGAGIARVLTRAGFRCVLGYHSNQAMAEELAEELKAAGGEVLLYQADVSDPAQAKAMVEEAVRHFGRLDVLVNNAAMQPNRFADQYDAALFRRLWDTNIGGYVNMAQAAIPYIRQSPQGVIVNMSSIHGKRPGLFDVGYAMTKGAIRMFTRELALELLGDEIPVNAIDLGACRIEFKTGNAVTSFRELKPVGIVNPDMPVYKREVLPEEVGKLVLFLLSRAGGSLVGDGIRLDRGLTLY